MTDWNAIHRDVVETFRRGWQSPHPHAWDSFLDDDVRFVQPMLADGQGPAYWWDEVARTLALLPDLSADVRSWAGSGDTLFIHIRLAATLGGRPLSWDAVDILRLNGAGKLVVRETYFDSATIAAALARRPSSWLSWWRSGIAPLSWRRKLLRPVQRESARQPISPFTRTPTQGES